MSWKNKTYSIRHFPLVIFHLSLEKLMSEEKAKTAKSPRAGGHATTLGEFCLLVTWRFSFLMTNGE